MPVTCLLASLVDVDTVCINQQDLLERNEQVTQMGYFYKHANRVVPWLALLHKIVRRQCSIGIPWQASRNGKLVTALDYLHQIPKSISNTELIAYCLLTQRHGKQSAICSGALDSTVYG
jgi:hypothetical protein